MKVAVIGLGRFGEALAQNLRESLHVHLIAVDRDRELVDRLNHGGAWARHFEGWGVAEVSELGIDRSVDVAVVAIGENAEEAQRWVVELLDAGVARILARAQSRLQSLVMHRLLKQRSAGRGGHAVIRPEQTAARALAGRILLPDLRQVVEIRDSAHSVVTFEAPKWTAGRSVGDLRLRPDFGINVLRILRGGAADGEEIVPVGPETVLAEGDSITVLGLPERIQSFIQGP